MVKRSLARKAELASRRVAPISRDGGISKDAIPMHRGRKKRLEARQRLGKKKDFIASELERLHEEAEKKREELRKRNAIGGPLGPALAVMGDMAAALPSDEADDEKEDEVPTRARPKIVRHKERRRIVAAETAQVNSIRAHPVFKENPMEALRQHLMNTVSGDPNEIPPALGCGDAGGSKKAQRAKKGNKGNNSSGGGGGGSKQKRDEKRGKGEFGLSEEKIERVRAEARERVAAKREQKAEYAEAAMKLKKKKQGGRIEKQTLKGLMSRPRGRIGVKRPKI